MSTLLVVASGGLGREAAAAAESAGEHAQIAFVDDDPRRWGTTVGGRRVLGGLDTLLDRPEDRVVVCAGSGAARRRLVERLRAMGVADSRHVCIVDPGVRWAPWRTGRGAVVLAGSVLTTDVVLAEHVVLMPQVTLTHDVVVESYATLCAGVSLGGSVRVGRGATIGMNASVREGVVVGEGAVLGMGSVLLEDLPPGETWAGVPARPLRARGVARRRHGAGAR
ncbi:DapH/DapD/GlmU-related protein [Nocardioides zeae]|uniref:DapH/DapD/GlmU-related protein n=1 Tax=Nocardioides imazamoxiresistens TaxID=3231893 RepID=A0ABU3PTJ9_9ACTN|nr:DapH/DapD/GlmU-related protein [Nocardioides zeae]MDT9592550.1 DapH/DapD/GlmU-related protein [Nocardioides zeae]